MKYGRIAPAGIPLNRIFGHFMVASQLPAPAPTADYTAGKAYAGALGNDSAGDCTIAGVYHLIQGWSAETNAKAPIVATDALALGVYEQLTGYNPATGANDTGMDETVVLTDWQTKGFPLPDGSVNKLAGWTACPIQPVAIQQVIDCFGGVYLGLQVPRSAEEQTQAGQPWTVPWYSPIVGLHCVVSQRYDQGYLYVDTWGILQRVAWDFVTRYFDACYAPLNPLWIDATGKAPNGLTVSQLTGDLSFPS